MTLHYYQYFDEDLMFASPLSSLKLALIAALSFCTTALSSAIVFEARTPRMNCFTSSYVSCKELIAIEMAYKNSWWPARPQIHKSRFNFEI